ncbi:phospholipase D-like domain-containing anti-phage protein [Paraburkholderia sp. BL17N1]|uniref:phospholipase D-like domain-containing anti-phage protein n=1 Tax=Paraburkholderia sp. BL17N1 TaxID=1938798 RepID=UPI000EB480A9|nr:phospholipase D-like domain-containing anti-phage protein [Paraburkholderia sp. BL17N1]RKR43442.1 helicase-like protein [Paraburkholderia sp. BL17N1]
MAEINRFSSRGQRLDKVFLAERLKGAKSYRRIAGYFRSSIFELVGEEIAQIPDVKIVCNSELDARDILVSRAVQEAKLREKWNELSPEAESLLHRDSYRKLYELLRKGNVQVRVVPKDRIFLHGKAGVVELASGQKICFLGSVNETRSAFAANYEILWEDTSSDGVDWVEKEFKALWTESIELPESIIEEVRRLSLREEVTIEKCDDYLLPAAALVESPIYRAGEQLQPWQRSFVVTFLEHRERYGRARLLLADEVGVGKTLSLAASAIVSALLGDGPVLILCPTTLTLQWQVELQDKLGVPSAVWHSSNKTWMDPQGRIIRTRGEEDVARCPYRIAIVSTGLIFQQSKERDILLRTRFGTVVLDEAHKARRKGGFGSNKDDANNLLNFMLQVGHRAKNVLLGTATPIQTEIYELWDLMRILNAGAEFVLGRESQSIWKDWEQAAPVVTGQSLPEGPRQAWEFIRCPLPAGAEHRLYDEVRNALALTEDEFFTTKGYSELPGDIRDAIQDETERNINGLGFFQRQNPIVRHTVLRQRRVLEQMNLLKPILVDVHPDPKKLDFACPGFSFEVGLGLPTNHFFDRAYQAAESFTAELRKRSRAAGFMRTMLLQRICSSFASGLSTAKMLLDKEVLEDDELDGEIAKELSVLTELEQEHLKRIVVELSRPQAVDPKLKAVHYFLTEHKVDGKTWLEQGCIIFSQYYDTAAWVAEELGKALVGEPVAVYAGVGKSRLYSGTEFATVEREQIKRAVKEREIRLVVATDAACEGLNLQTLGTLINVDLPWNPSKLEQRLGRIKRFGQSRDLVDMLNLVYHGTQDEKVYQVLSRRMKDRYNIFGSLPDTIDAEWIEDIEGLEQELDRYWARRNQTQTAFQARYQDSIHPTENRWELCEKVLSRQDFIEKLSEEW